MKKILSFDIGGTNTRLALVNEKLIIEKELIKPTIINSKEAFMENIFSMISEFDLKDVVGVGAGVPGVVNRETGYIYDLPNVHIKDIDFGKEITKKFNIPVFLRNDAEVACLAEAYSGAGKDYSRVFFITISTGLGGAMCVDNKFQDYITEVGHTLFKYKGSIEEYSLVSGSLLPRLGEFNNYKVTTPMDFFNEVRNKKPDALAMFEEWFDILNKYVKLMIDSYYPDIIVFTGGIMSQKDLFFDRLKKENEPTLIKECKYSTKAGLIGSATFAFLELGIIK